VDVEATNCGANTTLSFLSATGLQGQAFKDSDGFHQYEG